MSTSTRKRYQAEVELETVASQLSKRDYNDRTWFRDFLDAIFRSPDLDYSQFMEIERVKTRHELERNRLY